MLNRSHRVAASPGTATLKTLALVVATMALALLSYTAPAAASDEMDDSERYIRMMQGYVTLTGDVVEMAKREEAVVFYAIEGIVEIYERRGQKAEAIPHLTKMLENTDRRVMRNLIRLELRDLYNEFGRHDEALSQLDALVTENSD